ncbi:MAG: helix-hairpin-helix domain-containing protein [Acidobacteriota bacterium]
MKNRFTRLCVWMLGAAIAVSLATGSALGRSTQDSKNSGAPQINLNTATAEQLDRLPGVGPKTAALIIEYRQKNGGFKKVEDVMNVRGIGEKSFLKLRPFITVTPAKTDRPTVDK